MRAEKRTRPYRLDAEHLRLWRGSKAIPLRSKPFALLQYLVRNPGRLITKEELRQAVWPDTHVSPSLLKGYISELRGVLRDDCGAPCFIKTVGRQGYEWIGAISEIEPRINEECLRPRLAGRAEELAFLREKLNAAVRGNRQLLFVTGEPGIGKTALVEAFLAQEAVARDLEIARGQCIEHYGMAEPYLPLLEGLRCLSHAARGSRVLAVLEQHAPNWLMQMPALLKLMQREKLQSATSGSSREGMLRELAEAVEALAAERGLVLWLDDLQWSDHATLDWLTFVARRREPARLLVIGSYRPVDVIMYSHPIKGIKQELQLHGYCDHLPLASLTEKAVAEYLAMRFNRRTKIPLQALAHVVHRRTEGNPLFVINILDYAIARGMITRGRQGWQLLAPMEDLASVVPTNLRELIEKQLERLTQEEMQELEVASVAGQTFCAAAVASALRAAVEAVEEHCAELARRGLFLRESPPVEWPDGTVAAGYAFLHALYQQVLYDRVPAGRRVRLHQHMAERLELAHGTQAKEIAAELADHFERGRAYKSAMRYLRYAAKSAASRYAWQEVVALLHRGLKLLNTLADTPERTTQQIDLLMTLARALMAISGQAAPELVRTYNRARELCGRLGAPTQLYYVLWGLAGCHMVRAELQTAHDLGQQLITLAQDKRDRVLLVGGHMSTGLPLFWQGEFKTAQEHLEEGIASFHPRQQPAASRAVENHCVMLSYSAVALWMLGYPDQARKRSDEALTLARELAQETTLAAILIFSAWLFQLCREWQDVQERAAEAITLSSKQALHYWLATATILSGWARAEEGYGEDGIARMRRGLAAYRATGAELVLPLWLGLLTEVYGKTGRTEDGFTALAEAFAVVGKTGERSYEAELYRLQGELTLQTVESASFSKPDLDRAESLCLKAITIARRQSAKSLELRATMNLCRLWHRQKTQEAYALLSAIYGWFTEGFDTKELQDAKALLQQLNTTASYTARANVESRKSQ